MSDTQLTIQTARARLDEIVRRETSFKQKARHALDLGTKFLGADDGYLAVTDEQSNSWNQVVSTHSSDIAPHESTRDLATTYCRRTLETDEQIALHDAPNQGLADDLAFQTSGYHCYLGTPLTVDGNRYGTVCFVAEEPRSEPFDDAELLFAELVTRVLRHELKSDQKDQQLRNQANLTTVLNRVLRHNLRNNMTVIRGHTQVMADKLGADEDSGRVLESIDRVIELGEKARELESIIDQTATRQSTNIGALAAYVASTVEEAYSSATVTVDATEEITTAVRPSFEQALRELIENAAKHGGNRPTVTVDIERTPSTVAIDITDDGPGLPKQEQDVLKHEAETPLVHGSGLGLWLVHWVVTNHGGTIDSTVTETGTSMTLSIPRVVDPATETETSQQLPELTRARDQYRAAFEESNEAMVITDDDARIIDANSAVTPIYGVDRIELLGRPLAEFFPESFEFDSTWRSFQADGKMRDTMTVVDDNQRERVIEYHATADIVPGQHLMISHDITARIRREAELQMKTQAMDNAPIGISISDPQLEDNPLIYANEQFCDQLGYERFEIVGRNCRFPQGEKTDPEAVDRIRRGIANQTTVTEILRNYRKDGTEFWNRLTVAPVKNEQGVLTNYVGFQEEVTDVVERNRELEEMTKRLEVWMSLH